MRKLKTLFVRFALRDLPLVVAVLTVVCTMLIPAFFTLGKYISTICKLSSITGTVAYCEETAANSKDGWSEKLIQLYNEAQQKRKELTESSDSSIRSFANATNLHKMGMLFFELLEILFFGIVVVLLTIREFRSCKSFFRALSKALDD